MAEMGFRILEGGFVIAVHGRNPPGEAEWSAYIEALRQSPSPVIRFIVFTDGGKPTRQGFARLDAALHDRDVKTLIVTANGPARLVGTMLCTVFRFNASFSAPESVFDALDTFGITDQALAHRLLEHAEAVANELSPHDHLESLVTRRSRVRAG